MKIIPVYLLMLCLTAGWMQPAAAERYGGDPKDAPAIKTLLAVLKVQYQELDKLLGMMDRLNHWKQELDRDNARLTEESELAKQDRRLLDSGEMTQLELNKKWHESGRSLKHDREVKAFREQIARFNALTQDYNKLVKQMDHVLDGRSPAQVRELVMQMRKLEKQLLKAMDDGNIAKAKFIAKNSDVAAEFGYRPSE